MSMVRLSLIAALGLLVAACSRKSSLESAGELHQANEKQTQETSVAGAPARAESEAKESPGEMEGRPEPDQIGEDCVAFLRATTAVPLNRASGNCPQCPVSTNDPEVLLFTSFKINEASFSEETGHVDVEIQAQFNPSAGGTIVGGLIGWISPEQRKQYALGQTPAGRQLYKVRVIYRRDGRVWRAIEFDRAD